MTARKLVSVSGMGLLALALMAFQEEPQAAAASQGLPWLVWVLLLLVALGLLWLAWQQRDVDAFADAHHEHHDDHEHDGHDHGDHDHTHDYAHVSVEDENALAVPLTPVDDTIVVAPPIGAPEDIALASATEAMMADADIDRDAEPVGGDAAPAIVDTTPPVATPMSNDIDTEPLPPSAPAPVADVDTPQTTSSIGQNAVPTAPSISLQDAADKVQDEIATKGNSVSLGQNTRRDTMEFRVGEDNPGEVVQRPHNVDDTFVPTPMTNVAEERGDVPDVVGSSEPGVPDDLQIIEGIGPKIASVLIENGVRTFSDLASTDIGILEAILHNAGLSSITDPGSWSAQAALAADEKWDELEAMQKELKGGRVVE